MSPLLTTVRRTCERLSLLPPGRKVLVAVSGGADSTALLHALVRLGVGVEVAHLDHGLRGEESAEDARFVAGMAAGLGLPCHLRRLSPGELRRRGVSLEEAAREARLAWLEQVAGEVGAERIALGHTADDRAEEVLMRLLSGAGARGLSGLRPARGPFIRPLIEVNRAEVVAWLTGQGLTWREDPSNRDLRYLRNRVRHRLLPELETYNPSVRRGLLRQAELLGAEDELLDELAAARLEALAELGEGEVWLPCAQFTAEHPALQRRILRLALERLAGNLRGVAARHIEALRSLAQSARPSAGLRLPGGLSAERRYERLRIGRAQAPAATEWEHALPGPGRYLLPEAGRAVELRETQPGTHLGGAALFELAAIRWPLLARNPRPGDCLAPRGMGGRHKAVFRLLADAKVPRGERWRVPVLLSGGEVMLVGGLRASEAGRPEGAGALLAIEICALG